MDCGIWNVVAFYILGYKSQEKRGKSHRYDSKSSRLKKKPKDSSTRRSRVLSQHQAHTHSDEDEDESIPASYHTVSLQVSQDVSIARISSSPFLFLWSGSVFLMGQGRAASRISGHRMAEGVCGRQYVVLKEEACNLYWQKQDSSGERCPLKSKEEVESCESL